MLPDAFRNYLEVEKNYSANTVEAYLRDLRFFADFIESEFDFDPLEKSGTDQVSHKMIRFWMGDLMEQGNSRRTVARKIASVNAWYRFLRKTGEVEQNPAQRIKVPKYEKKLPSFLKEDSIDNLFEGIEYPETFEGFRDKCILEVLYSCGIRRSELVGLKTANVDFRACTLKVLGKGRKERVIPFGKMAEAALREYKKVAENEGFSLSEAFFLTAKGEPIYARLVNRIIEKYLSQVCSLKKKSPHVLRHTFATHLLNRGADLNAIKELLGHTSLAATQVYTHNSISKLKDVYKKAHPKA